MRYEEGTSDQWQHERVLCIAQMAATLKAGYMANAWNAEHSNELKDVSERDFALLAQHIFNAAEDVEDVLPPQSEARV